MESEALRNIKTMRQVKSSLEVARKRKIKTTSSLTKTTEELEHLDSIGMDGVQIVQILDKEKTRAVKFEASVERSRQKLLRSREKMAGIINRNRALTELRYEIQQDRDQKKKTPTFSPPLTKAEGTNYRGLREIDLKY